jgi:hypothetical protein
MAALVRQTSLNRNRASQLTTLALFLMLASSNIVNTAHAELTMPSRYTCMTKPALAVALSTHSPFALVSTTQLIDWHYSINPALALAKP